jgi:hypothetical protein
LALDAGLELQQQLVDVAERQSVHGPAWNTRAAALRRTAEPAGAAIRDAATFDESVGPLSAQIPALPMTASSQNAARDACARVGATLIRCQITERHLRRCLAYVFPRLRAEDAAMSWFDRLQPGRRDKTLGKLLEELRKSMDVATDFDSILDRFVMNRNRLAHHLLDFAKTPSLDGVGGLLEVLLRRRESSR